MPFSKKQVRFLLVIGIQLLGLIGICLISINTGYIRLTPKEVFLTLFGQGSEQQSLILFSFRMPRMVLAMLVGSGLSVSGCIFQAVSKNILASPSLLGINAGGGLAVMLYLYFLPPASTIGIYSLPVVSILGAGLAALLIYRLAYRKEEAISTFRLVLVGVAVSAGINALDLIVATRLSPETFNRVNVWTIGSVFGSNWSYVVALLPWILLIIPFFIYNAGRLDILRLSDGVSIGLGSDLKKERFLYLMLAVALAGASIAVGGAIGFVGLICPHLARKLVGPGHSVSIPTAAVSGAVLLAGADLIARAVIQPKELPLGIVVSIIGAPYFLYLLIRSK